MDISLKALPLHRLGKTARITLVPLLLLLALWLGGLEWYLRNMVLLPPEGAMPADAIVVLTGGSNRLDKGFDLLKLNLGKKLFISGVYHGVEVQKLLSHSKKAGKEGLDCCVVLGFEADDTVGNAYETQKWMAGEKFTSAYLVTANYHMERALLVFHTVMPDLNFVPWPVNPEGFDINTWWRDPADRTVILHEYMKYLVTLAWSPFAPWIGQV